MDRSDSDWDSSPDRNGSPKRGRRAAATNKTDLNAELSGDDANFTGDKAFAPPKPPRRRTGGWGETAAAAKSANGSKQNDVEVDEGNQNDGTTIPDLDDFEEEDMAAQIAKAPHVAVNRMATYRELDSDLSKHSAFTVLDDVDLKPLTKFLSPESEIREADFPWTWDNLIADVSTTLNRDTETGSEK